MKTFTFVNIHVVVVALGVAVAFAFARGLRVGISVRFSRNLILVPCLFLLLLFVLVNDIILFIHLVVSVLQLVPPIPSIPRTQSLALIMLARSHFSLPPGGGVDICCLASRTPAGHVWLGFTCYSKCNIWLQRSG